MMPERVNLTSQESPMLSTIQKSLFANEVAEQIRTVYDPEIPVNVYDMGLIYDIQVQDNRDVHIVMTLTSPACPVAGSLPGEVQTAARNTPGVGNVTVELTWDPPYSVDMMPEDVRLMLGLL
jgi:FeS assembly SUF system protein